MLKCILKCLFMLNLQPDLSGNPFFVVIGLYQAENFCKKDWERKADEAAIKITTILI